MAIWHWMRRTVFLSKVCFGMEEGINFISSLFDSQNCGWVYSKVPGRKTDRIVRYFFKKIVAVLMPSFKLQFNFIFISDIMFDKITKLPEEDQISEMAAVVGLEWRNWWISGQVLVRVMYNRLSRRLSSLVSPRQRVHEIRPLHLRKNE